MTEEFWRLKVGDVLAVNTGNDFGAFLIRLGAALRNKPNLDNHIAVMTGRDPLGRPIGVEARPGGVGLVDLIRYNNSYLITNVDQPKTDAQRGQIADLARSLLGVPYDWEAIGEDAMRDIGIPALWASKAFGEQRPLQVVCSSGLAWIYDKLGLPSPAPMNMARWVQPCDWTDWILKKGWQ